MNLKIETIAVFDKQFKRLAKKYVTLKDDLLPLIDTLTTNPLAGKPLGKGCYKIRLRIEAKHAGKSGGARVV